MPFSSIIGHRRVIEALKGTVLKGKGGQAYLFSGPEGVGKRLVALSLAKALNCEKGGEDFCDRCRNCRRIEGGNHPDVMLLRPEGRQIRIEQARKLQTFLQLGPLEGRWKIAIIDGAERMNLYAANSLLKTLEEPLPKRMIFLVAGRGGSIPLTILSRCQRVSFGPIGEEELTCWLERHLGIERKEARLRARFGEGSIARAIGLGEEIGRRRVEILKRLERLFKGERPIAFEWAEEFSKVEDVDSYLGLIKLILRDAIIYRVTGMEDSVMNSDLLEELKGLANTPPMEDLMDLWERVDRCHRGLYENMNRQLIFEWMLLGGGNREWRI